MKNKSKLAKKPLIDHDVPPPNPPLKADELIDLLERSHKENVKLVSDTIHDFLPIFLFIQRAIDEGISEEDLTVRLKDREVNYCHGGAAVSDILRWFCPRFYEASNKTDEADFVVSRAIEGYRKTHPKRASA
jgi:hypothetical protein